MIEEKNKREIVKRRWMRWVSGEEDEAVRIPSELEL